MNAVKPITPSHAEQKRIEALPPQVIEAFNQLIVENFAKGGTMIKQNEVIERILALMPIERSDIFARGYLDVNGYRICIWE